MPHPKLTLKKSNCIPINVPTAQVRIRDIFRTYIGTSTHIYINDPLHSEKNTDMSYLYRRTRLVPESGIRNTMKPFGLNKICLTLLTLHARSILRFEDNRFIQNILSWSCSG